MGWRGVSEEMSAYGKDGDHLCPSIPPQALNQEAHKRII
jgi:hypothetical protein